MYLQSTVDNKTTHLRDFLFIQNREWQNVVIFLSFSIPFTWETLGLLEFGLLNLTHNGYDLWPPV